MRIAIGGFQHESHSFAPVPTRWDDFLNPGGWPAPQRGATLLDGLRNTGVPAAVLREPALAPLAPMFTEGVLSDPVRDALSHIRPGTRLVSICTGAYVLAAAGSRPVPEVTHLAGRRRASGVLDGRGGARRALGPDHPITLQAATTRVLALAGLGEAESARGLGEDTLSGNEGADTLRGGQGADILTGGAGSEALEATFPAGGRPAPRRRRPACRTGSVATAAPDPAPGRR